ncbi:unnamed protein product [Closterium sp. NIES-53]
MATQKERSSSNGSPGTTPPPTSGLQTAQGTATRPATESTETPANQTTGLDPSMMEKFFSFMSFYEQHQQVAHAQSNNSDNNNGVTPMSLDGSSHAHGNKQQPTFAPVSQLMAKGILLEADSTTQEFKLFHGKGGLYIGKAVLKNNVFVLDFVPDQGTADSDVIVNFTSWTHPPDLDPDFSPGGFCRRDNIGSSRDNIGSSNNNYETTHWSFNNTGPHRRHATDFCSAVDSHSTRIPQKR